MPQPISLKDIERKVFRTTFNDGLWDISLGCFALIFVSVLYLSPSLGDFWSSMLYFPFGGLVFLVTRQIRKNVVTPRIGVVKFGQARKTRLTKLTSAMLIINVIALILGFIAFMNFGGVSGWVVPIIFGLVLLTGFSIAAYFMDFSRLYMYGLLLGISPLVGEWLFINGNASHHGWPITFGATAGIMILVGLVAFVRLLRDNPVPKEEFLSDQV